MNLPVNHNNNFFLHTAAALALSLATCIAFAAPIAPESGRPGAVTAPGPTAPNSTVILEWTPSADATRYTVAVRNIKSGKIVVRATVTGTSYTAELEPGTEYRWNVQACSDEECTGFTPALYFQTADVLAAAPAPPPPPPPVAVVPLSPPSSPVVETPRSVAPAASAPPPTASPPPPPPPPPPRADEKLPPPVSSTPPTAPSAPPTAAQAQPPGRVRVVYLNDSERKRILDELREEVVETAKREAWSVPGGIPEWVRNFQFFGDLLVRGEGDFYARNNFDEFINYQAINSGPPVDVQPHPPAPLTLPLINTTEDRVLPRLRLRFGANVKVNDDLQVGLRFATGNALNPVSTNQTLGSSFNKFSLLVDRAYLRYAPFHDWSTTLGRSPNPYATGVDLVWDRDLSFDGLSVQWQHESPTQQWRLVTGGFSVENTDPNYPSTSQRKFKSYDKWLWGTQLELTQQFNEHYSLRGDVGFYDFFHVEGKISSPCFAPNASVACDTDDSRPGFLQKGNSVMALRDSDPLNPTDQHFQYFGLASPFRVGVASLSFDSRLVGALHLAVDLEYARNFAFDQQHVADLQPDNNRDKCTRGPTDPLCPFKGGNQAYQAQVRVGHPAVRERGDWQWTLGYRYVQSDAVLDAFTDSDFHLGGTNAKGFYVGGLFGFAHNASIGARYLTATEVTAAPFAIDVLQLDLGVRF